MNTIKSLKALNQLQADTWVYGLIVAAVMLGIAILIAFLINWEGGADRSYIKRRICFIVLGLLGPAIFWIYNIQYVKSMIPNPGFATKFGQTNHYVLIVSIIAYFIVGVFLMFVFRHSKFGSILGKERNK
jgi:hypothetical protein